MARRPKTPKFRVARDCDIVFDMPAGTVFRMNHKPDPPCGAAAVRAYHHPA